MPTDYSEPYPSAEYNWKEQRVWYWDPVNGHDARDGGSPAFAVKTLGIILRRVDAVEGPWIIDEDTELHQLSDSPEGSDTIGLDIRAVNGANFFYYGKTTPTRAGTVGAVSIIDRTAGTPWKMSFGTPAPSLFQLVRISRQGVEDLFAFISLDRGPAGFQVTQPMGMKPFPTNDDYAFPTYATWIPAIGDHFELSDFVVSNISSIKFISTGGSYKSAFFANAVRFKNGGAESYNNFVCETTVSGTLFFQCCRFDTAFVLKGIARFAICSLNSLNTIDDAQATIWSGHLSGPSPTIVGGGALVYLDADVNIEAPTVIIATGKLIGAAVGLVGAGSVIVDVGVPHAFGGAGVGQKLVVTPNFSYYQPHVITMFWGKGTLQVLDGGAVIVENVTMMPAFKGANSGDPDFTLGGKAAGQHLDAAAGTTPTSPCTWAEVAARGDVFDLVSGSRVIVASVTK